MFREEGELLQHIATCDMIQQLSKDITNGNIINVAKGFAWGALTVLEFIFHPMIGTQITLIGAIYFGRHEAC